MCGSDSDDEHVDLDRLAADTTRSLPAVTREHAPQVLLVVIALAVGGTTLWVAAAMPFDYRRFTMLFLAGSVLVVFLEDCLATKNGSHWAVGLASRATALALGVGGAACLVYFFAVYEDLATRVLQYYWYEYVFAAFLLVVLAEGTRRAYGLGFAGVVYAVVAYAFLGESIPGRFGARSVDANRFLEITVLNLEGLFGELSVIGATWVAIFIIFAGFMKSYGGMGLFGAVGTVVGHRLRSGTLQLAVLTSMFLGSVTGSASANTAATGSFTIPLMKREGLDAETAAAIESVASSGGQLLPPVMGAAAFLMAQHLGVSYVDVMGYALVPALSFYLCLSLLVDTVAARHGAVSSVTVAVDLRRALFEGLAVGAGLAVLLYYLAVLRYDPFVSGFCAIGAAVVVRTLQIPVATVVDTDATPEDVDGTAGTLRHESERAIHQTLSGLSDGVRIVAPIMVVVGMLAVLLEVITTTGLNQALSDLLLAHGSSMVVLLVLAAVLSILFGLGMPTVAAYSLVAIVVAPLLFNFGVEKHYSHFFVFYFAVVSGITPPIAIVVAVASGIADADFFRTCYRAIPLAMPVYLLPFAFVVNPSLLEWSATTAWVFPVVIAGIVGVSLAILGFYRSPLGPGSRLGLAAAGSLAVFWPGAAGQVTGAVLAGCLLAYNSVEYSVSVPVGPRW